MSRHKAKLFWKTVKGHNICNEAASGRVRQGRLGEAQWHRLIFALDAVQENRCADHLVKELKKKEEKEIQSP